MTNQVFLIFATLPRGACYVFPFHEFETVAKTLEIREKDVDLKGQNSCSPSAQKMVVKRSWVQFPFVAQMCL